MSRIEELRSSVNSKVERLNELRSSLKEYTERAGEPTADEAERFKAELSEFNELEAEHERLSVELAQLVKIAEAPERAKVPGTLTVITRDKVDPFERGREFGAPGEVRSLALRAAEEEMVEVTDSQREQIADVIRRLDTDDARLSRHVIAHSRPEYRSAFNKLYRAAVRGIPSAGLTDDEQRAIEHARAVTITSGSAGTAIPTPLDPSIILTGEHSGSTNPWRRICRNLQTMSNTWNGVTSAGITVGYGAEAEEATDNSPTLGTRTITCYRGRGLVPFSMETDQDWAGMQTEMIRLLNIAKDDKDEAVFSAATAPAANTPGGLIYDLVTNYTSQIVASAGSNTFAEIDLHNMNDALPDRFEEGAAWLAAKETYSKTRVFASSGGGDPWEYLANGLPSLLLGYPHYKSPSIDSTFGSGENYILLLGRFNEAFGIVDRLGTTIELIPQLFGGTNNFPTGERGLFMNWRTGTGVLNQSAVVVLNVT